MPLTPRAVLFNTDVRAALQQAWIESRPGLTGGHEEGGFVVQDADGRFRVIRWPRGRQDAIQVPPHPKCSVNDLEIVASFHTHPNTGNDYLQEPGETDKRAVRDDPDLKGADYVGEFVVTQMVIYLIAPTGRVREMDDTQAVFTE